MGRTTEYGPYLFEVCQVFLQAGVLVVATMIAAFMVFLLAGYFIYKAYRENYHRGRGGR